MGRRSGSARLWLRRHLYEEVIKETSGRHAPEMLRFGPLLAVVGLAGAGLFWLVFVGLARLEGAQIDWWWAEPGDLHGSNVFDLARATATLIALFGGLFAVVYAYRKQRIEEAAGRRADEENVREIEGQITERWSRSVEQVGHENRAVRIGGLYALERIGRDASGDRDTVTQLLNAFVREWRRSADGKPAGGRTEADVQIAISILGRRQLSETERCLDFYNCAFDDASFSGGSFGNAMFYYCRLHGTSFARADVSGAGLSFCDGKGVAFTNASARGANFVNARYVNGWFLSADLEDADFYGCDLSGSDFGRRYAEEGDPPMEAAWVHGARFTNAILEGTNLRGVDLSSVRGLQPDQLAMAITDENTIAPNEWGGGEDEYV